MYTKANSVLHKHTDISPYPKKDLQLAKSCQDFESVFLTAIWRNMAKSTGMKLGAWDVLLSQAMGKTWAEAGGIGLAKVLYDQLSKSSSSDLVGDDGNERSVEMPE